MLGKHRKNDNQMGESAVNTLLLLLLLLLLNIFTASYPVSLVNDSDRVLLAIPFQKVKGLFPCRIVAFIINQNQLPTCYALSQNAVKCLVQKLSLKWNKKKMR